MRVCCNAADDDDTLVCLPSCRCAWDHATNSDFRSTLESPRVSADTVISASPATLAAGVATGLAFHPTDAVAFGQALARLVTLYGTPDLWARVQRNAMQHPVGWETSAAAYAALYARALA